MQSRSLWLLGSVCFVLLVLGALGVLGVPAVCGLRHAAAGQPTAGRMVFSHIGVITTEKKPGERYVPATKVWVTDFQNHPYHVEWLRYEPDSPVKGPVRETPHVAYAVKSIEAASVGLKELLAPFDAGIARVAFYQTDDGAIVEFMEFKTAQK